MQTLLCFGDGFLYKSNFSGKIKCFCSNDMPFVMGTKRFVWIARLSLPSIQPRKLVLLLLVPDCALLEVVLISKSA